MTLTFDGLPCCICQQQWLTAFFKELDDRKIARPTIAQLIGDAPASKGRHLGGGNIDWWSVDVSLARLARAFGGLAMLRDGTRDSFDNNKHTHTYLPGCPHMSEGAQRDMAEVLAGGDGLVGNVPDDPRLKGAFVPGTTWQKGVQAMEKLQLKRQLRVTFGTHNTLDGAGRETPFADIIIFTEAIPAEVRQGLGKTHRVWVCPQQKDLELAIHRRLKPKMIRQQYRKAHGGIPLVTPKRGVWKTSIELLGGKAEFDGIWEHRINAAFPPFVRGEKILRPRYWRKITSISKEMIRASKAVGVPVLAGGDLNTPRGITGYGNTLRSEVGEHFDRLGSTLEITEVEELSKAGSDHHRLRGVVQL